MEYRTPLGKARGLGSAKSGTGHWWLQRLTAVALIPLSLWFVVFLVKLPELNYSEMVMWLSRPWNSILLIAYLWAALYHGLLGFQVVIEDYVHHSGVKLASLITLRFLWALLAVTALWAILR
ncbi:MAG: succinate dehydrogenase [Methylothermaceae bacteria B42]|nr:MAG: succinate dehydrogenase [Methylothermaceae bacteria B42]HHJ39481.1 succinate dehydrogenase, hydrophobic membrane anchor protein [Methylothermaceae bacterium]